MILVLLLLLILLNIYLFQQFPAPSKPKDTSFYDVIIVLGCPCKADGSISVMQRERMDKAISLYTQKKALYLIVSGGSIHNNHNEALCMKKYALSKNIEEQVIITENKAANTFENLKLCKQICIQQNFHKVLVITSDFHIRRSAFFVRNFFNDFDMDAADHKSPFSLYMQEYFRLWNTLYYEQKLKKKKQS